MSARFSNSPALHLTVGSSALRRVLVGALYLCTAYSLYRLYLRGYPLLSLSLLPLAVCCCWRLGAEPWCGVSVCWRRGQWSLEQGEKQTVIVIGPGSTCLPWLIYLAWTELPGGRSGSLWLFPDSAPAAELRRLRVRLTLER